MKLVVVGGVAGGASAAARARRLAEDAEIILIQSGPDVSFASCGMVRYFSRLLVRIKNSYYSSNNLFFGFSRQSLTISEERLLIAVK